MSDFMKRPCEHCPYRKDIKPFLTPERGEELAVHASNPYNVFWCHKTTVSDEEFGGEGSEMVEVETSKICAGFLALQINDAGIDTPEGFEPAWDVVYSDGYEMLDAYS